MIRQIKAHDERRNEILDVAWELLTSRGYERTTVAVIIEKIGIAKGTFYHYFRSKEQVLDAVADRMSAQPLAELEVVVADESLDAAAKLDRVLEVARRSRLRRIYSVLEVARVLYRDENLVIRHKIGERVAELMQPVLRSVIQQGLAEGCFEVAAEEEAARLIWAVSSIFADHQMRTMLSAEPVVQRVDEMMRRAELVAQSLERMLCARAGSLSRPSRELLERFVRAADAGEGSARTAQISAHGNGGAR